MSVFSILSPGAGQLAPGFLLMRPVTLLLALLLAAYAPDSYGQTVASNPARLPGFFWGGGNSLYISLSPVTRLGVLDAGLRKTASRSLLTPEIFVGWQSRSGWQWQFGYGFGYTGAVRLNGSNYELIDIIWKLPLSRAPLRLTRLWPLGDGRLAAGPQLGLVYNFWEKDNRGTDYSTTQPIASAVPERGSITEHLQDLGRYHTLNYELAGELAYQLTANTSLGLVARYTNSFGSRYVARMTLTYDNYGVPQPPLVAQSKLEAWALGLTLRRGLFRKPPID